MKLTNITCACNSLTYFDYICIKCTLWIETEILWSFQDLVWTKFVKSHQVSIILPNITFKRFMKLVDHNYLYRPATVWQNLNMNQLPETEIKWIVLTCFWNLEKNREITSSKLIFGGKTKKTREYLQQFDKFWIHMNQWPETENQVNCADSCFWNFEKIVKSHQANLFLAGKTTVHCKGRALLQRLPTSQRPCWSCMVLKTSFYTSVAD